MMNKKAFTLVEVIMAITIVTVALVAVYGLIISVLTANQRNIHNLQAGALAAEGLEVVRYLRDSNWLQNYSWTGRNGELSVVDPSTSKIIYLVESESAPYWKINGQQVPPYKCGKLESIVIENGITYCRFITLSKVYDPENSGTFLKETMQVTSTVSWDEKGITKQVELSTFLSNWHD